MSNQKLIEEAEALNKAATPGPWQDDHRTGDVYAGQERIVVTDSGHLPPELYDARFIARSRTLVPELSAALRQSEERGTAAEDENDRARQSVLTLEAATQRLTQSIERLIADHQEARSALARLTTPRPIEEAPKDGRTWILGLWPHESTWPPMVLIWLHSGWHRFDPSERDEGYLPSHFLPLPVPQ